MRLFFYIICMKYVQVFTHYTFYQVIAFNSLERNLLYNYVEMNENVYFLNGVTNEAATTMDVVVNSCCTRDFEEILVKYDIEYSCVARNNLSSMDYDITNNTSQKNILDKFLSWDDVLLWVDSKVKENSALTKTVIAKTYEHRDVFVLKLAVGKSNKKMAIFIVAGEEGRDWLSSALLLNYINRLLESTSTSDTLLEYYDMYFIPILNPDGFVYSKQKDRMWAKNRKLIQPQQICGGHVAVGVNIDKNWFGATFDSTFACNSIYSGSKALSEEETQGLSYILNSIALKLMAFINLRGFGNIITLPYAQDKEISPNHYILTEIMKHTSAVLKVQYNKNYPVGTTSSYLYNFTGNMPDWVKKKLNTPVVFTVYLQHENFLPKESHILPVTNQLESLLNISLVISREIYGSLYNIQNRRDSNFILMIIILIHFLLLYH